MPPIASLYRNRANRYSRGEPMSSTSRYSNQATRAPHDEQQPTKAADPIAPRHCLLHHDEQRDRADPNKVHHSAHEQERHQHPAAAETEEAEATSGSDRAEC